MKKIILTLLAIFSLGISWGAKPQKASTPEQKGLSTINKHSAEAFISFLASDELEGREAGTAGGKTAGMYIASILKEWGVEPLNENSYFQPFKAYRKERQKKGRLQVHPDSIAAICKDKVYQVYHMRNVLCKIKGKRKDEIVIIGAHYDHLGIDPFLDGDKIYNGADDNASGVSAVLQILRAFLATGTQPERTVIFAFWDGEEKGLLGSKYFTQSYPDMNKVKGYLNFDMIGRNMDENQPKHVVFFYTENTPSFEKWLRDDIKKYDLQLEPNYRAWDKPIGGSDNTCFALRNIPIMWYHTNGHPDYHMPSDETHRINWDKLVDITKASFLGMWKMANCEFGPTLTRKLD